MELLGERPTWSMSGSEMLSTLDQLDAELARLETYRLQLIAGLDTIGHAQEIGAHDTAQLIEFRYRLDRVRARRDVRLATALAKYDAVAAALPAPDHPVDADPQPETVASDARSTFLRPAQAEVIVSALEQVPLAVPVEDLAVAERELVGLAQHLSPAELRRAGQRVRDVLDTDGPEPEEHKAYARENLTLTTADRGVKFLRKRFGEGGRLALDERALGVGVAAVALALRTPVLVTVVLAAVVTALARLFLG